jgi:hypothetical protein
VPSQEEVDLIRSYCKARAISTDNVHFIIDFSQNVLPSLRRRDLDLVLIDGGHGYPVPAIDWFYAAPMLRRGGLVVIDDIQIWTGLELKRFLAEEPDWRLETTFSRAVAFRKTGEKYARDWNEQSYIRRRSRWPIVATLLKSSFNLLIHGELRELARKSIKTIRRTKQ